MTKNVCEKQKYSKWKEIKADFAVNKSLYLLFLPVLIYFAVFSYGPMYGAIIAFKNFSPQLGILGSPWVGMHHFKRFVTSPSFWSLLGNTFKISLTSLVFGFPAPILLALLLNELKSDKFAKVVQNFTYMPHFISLVVICGMIKTFTRDTGVITYVLSFFGMERVTMLTQPKFFVPIYVASGIWQEIGWGSIVYLAALTGVDASLYEAAAIDGAGRFRKLVNVTLPSIIPTIIIMLILRVGGILNVGYEKIILLYNDATLEVADVISTYVYRKGLLDNSWSFSTAVNMFNSVVNLVFLGLTNYISGKYSDSKLW